MHIFAYVTKQYGLFHAVSTAKIYNIVLQVIFIPYCDNSYAENLSLCD